MEIEEFGRFHTEIRPLSIPIAAIDLNGRILGFSDGFAKLIKGMGGSEPRVGMLGAAPRQVADDVLAAD